MEDEKYRLTHSAEEIDEAIDAVRNDETIIAQNRAALAELVDSGAKNVLTIPDSLTLQDEVRTSAEVNEDGTITVNVLSALPTSSNVSYSVTVPEGDYVFSCGAESGTGQTSKYDCCIWSESGVQIRDNSEEPGNSAHIPAGTYTVIIRMRTAAAVGEYTFKPMLGSQAAWSISQSYQPYRPSWQELYDFVKNCYTKAQTDNLLSGKQATIDSSHKLSSDLVDDSSSTNKFATAAQLQQIETNKTNILSCYSLENGTIIPANTDLNNITEIGTYSSDASSANYTHVPAGVDSIRPFRLIVQKDTKNNICQIYDEFWTPNKWQRPRTVAGIWGEWVMVQGNFGALQTNVLSIQAEQVVQNNEIATLREITNCKLYGYRIDKNDVNPDTRVTYLYDAVGMTPAYMDFIGGSFNYGSWGNIWFVKKNRPVALLFDGTVDYELDHTDFTKKLDGTASDVEDVTYGGNFMSEIPLVYVKRWEDSNYNYVVFSETKPNDDYLAQAHTNANGTINDKIYLPMFKGSIDANNKLRSLMGTIPNGKTTTSDEVDYVSNCGTGWQLWDKAKIDLVMDLIVLITKSTNCRLKIGNGDCNSFNASDNRRDSKNNGANGKMMSGYEVGDSVRSANAQFYGYEGTEVEGYGVHHMIAFYIEDLWGNYWERCLGFNLVDNVYKVKMTPPYSLDGDSTYQSLSVVPPSSDSDWLKNMSTGIYGDVPVEVGASDTTGYASWFSKNANGTRLALFGGGGSNGTRTGRYWVLNRNQSDSQWYCGASPCYSAP